MVSEELTLQGLEEEERALESSFPICVGGIDFRFGRFGRHAGESSRGCGRYGGLRCWPVLATDRVSCWCADGSVENDQNLTRGGPDM